MGVSVLCFLLSGQPVHSIPSIHSFRIQYPRSSSQLLGSTRPRPGTQVPLAGQASWPAPLTDTEATHGLHGLCSEQYIYIYICISLSLCIYLYLSIYLSLSPYIYIYIHIYIYIYIYIYTTSYDTTRFTVGRPRARARAEAREGKRREPGAGRSRRPGFIRGFNYNFTNYVSSLSFVYRDILSFIKRPSGQMFLLNSEFFFIVIVGEIVAKSPDEGLMHVYIHICIHISYIYIYMYIYMYVYIYIYVYTARGNIKTQPGARRSHRPGLSYCSRSFHVS